MTWQSQVEHWRMDHIEIMVTLGCNQFAIQEDLFSWILQNGPSIDKKAKENLMEILIRFQAISLEVVTYLLDIAKEESAETERMC